MSEEETLGSLVLEIRDLLRSIAAAEPEVVPTILQVEAIPRPKATDWKYGQTTTVLSAMSDIVSVKAKTAFILSPACVIVRVAKESIIDICMSPKSDAYSEIIAPGAAPDNGIFIHWFPYGVSTIGGDADIDFWVRAQGVTETGLAEAELLWEEVKI